MLSMGAESAREEVERWRGLVDHLPALVAYWDQDQRNVVANAAYLRWFGLTPHEMQGMHIKDVLGPAVYQANLRYITGALAGDRQHFDRTLVTALGETRHTQAEYIPHLTQAGVVGFYVLVADITDQVEAQRDLLAVQALARMGSYTFEPSTRTLRLSPELTEILGFDAKGPGPGPGPGLEGYLAAVHPEDQEKVVAMAMQVQPYETSYRMVRPDGGVMHLHSRTSQVFGPDGSVVLLRGVMQDETEVQLLADELATANRVLTDLIGMLGHDLSQPVAVTNGYLEHLDQEWEQTPEDERRSLVQRARRGGRRVAGLLSDILATVNLESSELVIRAEPVDVAAAFEEAQAETAFEFSVVRETSALAWVDPVHLGRIIDNLLSNADRYGRAPYVVRIWQVQDKGRREVVASVRDHGDGVTPEFVPRLFQRFARARTAAAADVSGTGLGLYLVSELARVNDGTVQYRAPSDPPGALFELRLPATPDS